MALDSMQEIFDKIQAGRKPFWQVVRDTDVEERQVTAEASFEKMHATWRAMVESVDTYRADRRSVSGLVGGDAQRMWDYAAQQETLCGPYLQEVIATALCVAESNACMHRIVAAPTAGACGVLPAVLVPLYRRGAVDEEAIVRALYVAAGIGAVVGYRASISGASGGCQAEVGTAAAMAAGACAGFITAFLQTRLGVPSILAGIVTNTGLYTINLMAMGWKSNASLLGVDTIVTMLRDAGVGWGYHALLLAAVVTIVAGALLYLFLGTRLGLSIRATGDNRDMVRASSVNPTFTITVGLCVANALTALSGAMVGQYQKTVDINSGTGIVVIGLACLIIGETVLGRRTVFKGIIAVMLGSILYRFIYAIVFYTKVVPVDCLKLLTAVIVGLAIAAPSIKKWAAFQKRKLAAGRKGGV